MGDWSKPISGDAAACRAGGRRRYNAKKKRQMWARRFAILRIIAMSGEPPHGCQRLLAEHFGVNKSVISRDLEALRQYAGWVIGSGLSPLKCTYRRNTVSIEYRNPMPPISVLIRACGGLKALKAAANRDMPRKAK